MRVLVKLFGWLVVFVIGLIAGFLISPAKQGIGTTVNHNYYGKPVKPEVLEDNENESCFKD